MCLCFVTMQQVSRRRGRVMGLVTRSLISLSGYDLHLLIKELTEERFRKAGHRAAPSVRILAKNEERFR